MSSTAPRAVLPTADEQAPPSPHEVDLPRSSSASANDPNTPVAGLGQSVSGRLRSLWSRPLQSTASQEETNLMHEWIAHISPNTQPGGAQLQDSQWEAVKSRCSTHPHEASQLDRRGRTCLHAACAKKPPITAVSALVTACGRHADILLESDQHGRTPLSIAVWNGADNDVVSVLVQLSPASAALHDSEGHLPLHLACTRSCTGQVEVVSLLLQAFPEGVTHENFAGWRPLHTAIHSPVSVEVIRLLVEADPEGVVNDNCGTSPLYMAILHKAPFKIINCLVEANPSCISTRDRNHGFPLRRAIEHRSSIEIQSCFCTSAEVVLDTDPHVHKTALHEALERGMAKEATVALLLRTAPGIALTRSKSGQTPLILACQEWQKRTKLNYRPDEPHVQQAWRTVEHLMRAAFYGSLNNAYHYPVLHAAVGLQVPSEVVQYAIAQYLDQPSRRDFIGRYPLQLAIENRPPVDFPFLGQSAESYTMTKECAILKLLDTYPEAARSRDCNGRGMLSLAAESNSVSIRVLQQLWSLDTSALDTVDPLHKLYPFQIAAMPKQPLPKLEFQKATREWFEAEELLHLESIFQLLKQVPKLVVQNQYNEQKSSS